MISTNLPSMLVHVDFSTKHQEPLITEEIEALWRWRERWRRPSGPEPG